MSEALREHDPLLYEDFSEEEHFADYKYRPSYRGRARNKIKGAAAIIANWSDNSYLWMTLSMVALLIFVVYNSIIAFVLLPPVDSKPTRPLDKTDNGLSQLPEVYMHFFTSSKEETDLHKHLPHIEYVADKYADFKFNIVVILNDTNNNANSLSAEENNELAFNSLWSKEHFYDKKISSRKNIYVKQLTLSYYMNESPLRNNWRKIPEHYFPFVVRAVSIWEQGGIAINPDILTPRSPNAVYKKKFENILQKYILPKEIVENKNKPKINAFNKFQDKFPKKVNNIQDIIDILQHDNSITYSQENLTEAEDKDIQMVSDNSRKLLSSTSIGKNKTNVILPNYVVIHPKVIYKENETSLVESQLSPKIDIKPREAKGHSETKTVNIINTTELNHDSKLGLLNLFLDFLFHDNQKPKLNITEANLEEMDNLIRKRKSVIPRNSSSTLTKDHDKIEGKNKEQIKPMIVSAKGLIQEHDNIIQVSKIESDVSDFEELTIDLKGNIIATKASCHAFLGMVFTNLSRYSAEKSLQDFIIAELSLFCKGLLSSCRGMDVILV